VRSKFIKISLEDCDEAQRLIISLEEIYSYALFLVLAVLYV